MTMQYIFVYYISVSYPDVGITVWVSL